MTVRRDKAPTRPVDATETPRASVLTINAGSSSIRFALYPTDKPLERVLSGKVNRIGRHGASLTFHDAIRNQPGRCSMEASDHTAAAGLLIDWFEEEELHRVSPYDPDHLPQEIGVIEAFRQRHPKLPHIACFDTASHSDIPRVFRLLAIPRRFDPMGIQRYGFHGLSYAFLMEELGRVAGEKAARGRVILAHPGHGASIVAVRGGKGIDTTMGFTPVGGLPNMDPRVA